MVNELDEYLEWSHIPLFIFDEHVSVPLQYGWHPRLFEPIPKLVMHLRNLMRHEHVQRVPLDLGILVPERLGQDLIHVEYLAHVLEVAVHYRQGGLIERLVLL